jgi:hypothetical protein
MTSVNMDIRKSNNVTVEMAIANFFHCKDLLDVVVESPRYLRLVRLCRLVGDDFVVPIRKKIGGDQLGLNFANIYKQKMEDLLKEVKVFELAFLGDCATIHRMPLMNILAMSGVTPPITISIQDCTSHMAEGGKKDASYIADLFGEKVLEFNPHKIFEGAVWKAGELVAHFPRLFCVRGGERVVSLFFHQFPKSSQ